MLVKRLVVFAVIAILPAFAQFRGARIDHSKFIGAHMGHVDFSDARLDYCDLSGADLNHANLSRAVLNHSDLNHANLSGAELSGADLRTVENLAPKAVKAAKNWKRAFYDDRMLKALGLPADHNAGLAEQLNTEEKLQKR